MNIKVMKSKIHRVKVTDANLDYIGSITIDKDLMDWFDTSNESPYMLVVSEIKDDKKLHDKNVVKVVFDKNKKALFFSRYPLPFLKGKSGKFFQQLGLYIYSKEALNLFSKLPSLSLEKSEQVELLRFLEHGYSVEMTKVRDVGLSVDIPEDIKLVEDYLNKLKK